jgi:hypothetical protein
MSEEGTHLSIGPRRSRETMAVEPRPSATEGLVPDLFIDYSARGE